MSETESEQYTTHMRTIFLFVCFLLGRNLSRTVGKTTVDSLNDLCLLQFYNDFTPILVRYQQKVNDLVFARKTEREELSRLGVSWLYVSIETK